MGIHTCKTMPGTERDRKMTAPPIFTLSMISGLIRKIIKSQQYNEERDIRGTCLKSLTNDLGSLEEVKLLLPGSRAMTRRIKIRLLNLE